jgi:hypothetical protein
MTADLHLSKRQLMRSAGFVSGTGVILPAKA